MADADLGRAAEAAYAGAFWSAGQKCTATRRIYVQDGAYDAFRDAFLARVESGKVGDPADPETEVGPLVNESAMEDVLGAIERGRSEGGSVLAGGSRADDDAYLVAPTVFEDVADDAMLSCEEVFGPVTSLYRFGSLDEAIERANAVEFGLSAALFTSSLPATQQFVDQAEAGILHVNSQTAGADVHVPFGGVKSSGFGPHEQGRAAREFYTEVVTVYQDAARQRGWVGSGSNRRGDGCHLDAYRGRDDFVPPRHPELQPYPAAVDVRTPRTRAARAPRSPADPARSACARPTPRGRPRARRARPSRS